MRSAVRGYCGINPPILDRTGGRALTAAIRAARVSRNQLAESTGLARNTIQNLERGSVNGRAQTWRALARALGTTPDRLVGEE